MSSDQTGPALAIQLGGTGAPTGGIDQVIAMLVDGQPPGFETRAWSTQHPSSRTLTAWRTVRTAVLLLTTARARRAVVTVHLSQRGSFVREGALLRLAALLRLPTVAYVHGSSFPAFAGRRPRIVRAVLQKAGLVLVLTEAAHQAVAAVTSRPLHLFSNAAEVRDAAPQGQRIVFAGAVGHRKGVDTLLAAWQGVSAPEWTLDIYGACERSSRLDLDGPRIRYLGARDHEDVLAAVSTCSIAVLPSREEAMPLFVLEAMAAGTCVIATSVGAIGSLLADGAGLLVEPDDVTALRSALQSAIDDPALRTATGSAARARVVASYSRDDWLRRIAEHWLAVSQGAPSAALS